MELQLSLPRHYVKLQKEEMMYLEGGGWLDKLFSFAGDVSLTLGLEIGLVKATLFVLGGLAVTNPIVISAMAVIGLAGAASVIWRGYVNFIQ